MKARHQKRRRSRSRFPFFFIGAMGALIAAPRAHGADRFEALPVERRVTIEPARIEAALGHIKIWTPSETLPSFSWQEVPGAGASASQSQSRTFDIPPGSLETVLKAFETVTGVKVALAEEGLKT